MKILRYWGSHFKTRREVGVVVEEFRPMIRRGWQCYLVLEREPAEEDWLAELKTLGIGIHLEARPTRKFDPKSTAQVIKLCRRLRPDVFLCENIHDSPLLGATLAFVPVRVWIKRAMNSAFERGERQRIRNRLEVSVRMSCAMSTRVLAVSSAVRDELVRLGVSHEKILVRPNPRRLGDISVVKRKDDVRRIFDLADTDVVWTSVGHAVPVKGWDMLIRAFHRVAASESRAKLLLVGSLQHPEEGATAAILRSEIKRLGLEGRVTLTGQVEDVASLLRASDAFVMSSHSEGFSIALIEALEAGLPCLATRVGIATDVIRHGFNGMLVDRFNEDQMSAALLDLTSDNSLRMRLSRNSRVPEMIPTLEDYARRLADDLEDLRNRR